jgi:hypothetical protein
MWELIPGKCAGAKAPKMSLAGDRPGCTFAEVHLAALETILFL